MISLKAWRRLAPEIFVDLDICAERWDGGDGLHKAPGKINRWKGDLEGAGSPQPDQESGLVQVTIELLDEPAHLTVE